MSVFDVGTAFVRVLPDTTKFRAALEAELLAITKSVQTTVPVAPVLERTAVATGSVSAGTTAAAAATTELADSAAVASASVGNLAKSQAAAAATATELGVSEQVASKGLISASTRADILQGSIVGISRVTAISALGLTAWSAAAVAAGLAIRAAIVSTADFEHQLNVFQGTTGATAEQMKAVADEAKALGADLSLPATSAGDAALAMTELAKAGLSVEESLAGAKGVLQLAAAAQISVGTAADFVATELNAFRLSGSEATHVADLLAGASIAAQGSIQDFGNAFQQVSAVSHQVNLSLESTTGALTELAQAGLKGADGGTSLRTTLLRLAPTTKQAAEFQKALGIQIDNTRSVGQQLPELLDQYKRALEALTPVQQQQVLTQIFGQDAIRAASILIQGGSAALRDNTDAANQNGAAARLAAANARGLSGAFAGLKSNLDTTGITMGNFVKGPLTLFIDGLSLGVGGINQFIDELGKLGGAVDSAASHVPGLSEVLNVLFKPTPEKIAFGLTGTAIDAGAAIAGAFGLGPGKQSPFKKALEDAKQQNDAFVAGLQKADQDFAKGIHDESVNFGNSLSQAAKIHDESGTSGITALSDSQKKAIQKAVEALNNATGKGQSLQVKIPLTLQSNLIDAQIAGNLQAEAAIDKKIVDFLTKIRNNLDHNSAAYVAVGQQIAAAKQAEQSALDQATAAASAAPKIPIKFQNQLLDAEIAKNLQDEAATDQKIIDWLTKQLERAKGNAQKYNAIAALLKQFTDARDAVLNEVSSQQKQKAQDQQNIFQTNLQNQQTRLELAADAAGATSDAEQRLIVFLTKEAHDERLTTAQQLAFEKERRAEVLKRKTAIVETAKAQIDLRNAILDTRLSAADLTTSTEDNKRVMQAQIQAAKDQIVLDQRVAAENKKGSQARIDALIDIQTQLQKINNLKASIKGLTSQGQSFTLQDLFKEAEAQFSTFGSNIAPRNGVLSPQDVRGDFGRTILQVRDASLGVQTATLTEAEKQTALLQSIDANLRGVGVSNPALARNLVSQAGNFGGWRAAREAANNLYAAN